MKGPRAWVQARRHRRLLADAIDRDYYLAQLGGDPGPDFDIVEHYLTEGWRLPIDPAPWFDSRFYTAISPDVARAGVPPFAHYLAAGEAEDRPPLAVPHGLEDVRPWFDAAFYAARNPDVAAAKDVDAFEHYSHTGWHEGREANAWFDARAYRAANPGLPDDINLLAHYLREGARHGRPLRPGAKVWTRPPDAEARRRLVSGSGLLDGRYYLSTYPDVAASGLSALDHYLLAGAAELRNPGPRFDTGWWATTHDVAPMEALAHFLAESAAASGLPPLAATFDPARPAPPVTQRLAAHLHLRHIEAVDRLAAALDALPVATPVWATVFTPADAAFAERRLRARRPQAAVEVRVDPARGMGLLPDAFADRADQVDLVLCLHSELPGSRGFDAAWQARALGGLLGAPTLIAQAAAHMAAYPELGWLHPEVGHETRQEAPATASGQAGAMGWLRAALLPTLAAQSQPAVEAFDPEGDGANVQAGLDLAVPARVEAAGARSAPFACSEQRAAPSEPLHTAASRFDAGGRRWPREDSAVLVHTPKPLAPRALVFDPARLDVAWIMPDLLQGSGGHMTILRMVEQFAAFGHRQTIWMHNPRQADPQAIKRRMQRWFRPIPEDVAVVALPDDVRAVSADAVIATEAWSAFPAANVTDAKARFYFIQDYEPLFHAAGEAAIVAEQTYRLGLDALTAGDWLLGKARDHGMWARKWDLAVDHAIYHPSAERPEPKEPPRIAVYARASTPRRMVGLALAGLQELHRRGVAFEAVLFGDEAPPAGFSFPHAHVGVAPPRALGELYRACDIGLVFSATNYSLAPLEMMACDLPVVELDGESTRAVFREGEVRFAAPQPQSVADALQALIEDPAERRAQAARGRGLAERLSWEISARALEAAIVERLGQRAKAIDPARVCAPAIGKVRRVSVVIPTHNGGRLFDRVLAAAASQDCAFEYDVLVLDSTSTDRTAEVANKVGGRVWLHTIPKGQFQHGRTRNLGVELTDGDIVAFLTQDALPGDRMWLSRLVEGFDASPRTALVFGRHRAYPAHGLFAARDLDQIFDRFHMLGPLFSARLGLPSFIHAGGDEWRRLMGFHSDNNSALLRAAWKELPYPEIDWGEDQVLGWEMIRQGFDKAYADEAVVFHSHQRKASEQLQVGVEEGRLFKREFGADLVRPEDAPALLAAITAADTAWAREKGLSDGVLAMRLESQRLAHEGRLKGAAGEAWEL